MGTILTPVCKSCMYRGDALHVGCGMNKMFPDKNPLYFPGIDNRTRTVEIDDLREPQKSPHTFIFYDQPGMTKPKKKKPKWSIAAMFRKRKTTFDAMDYSGHILERDHNLCPKCNAYELSFLITGLWD